MPRRAVRVLVAIAMTVGIGGTTARLGAQARPPAKGAAPAPPALPPEGYTYDPAGRRDPFVSLVTRGSSVMREGGKRLEGLAGVATNEIVLKGTMVSRGQYLALVQGADGKTYIVRPNDRLLDGVVQAVTATQMIIRQQVNDPLSLDKQRDVRKLLRPNDDVK